MLSAGKCVELSQWANILSSAGGHVRKGTLQTLDITSVEPLLLDRHSLCSCLSVYSRCSECMGLWFSGERQWLSTSDEGKGKKKKGSLKKILEMKVNRTECTQFCHQLAYDPVYTVHISCIDFICYIALWNTVLVCVNKWLCVRVNSYCNSSFPGTLCCDTDSLPGSKGSKACSRLMKTNKTKQTTTQTWAIPVQCLRICWTGDCVN